MILKALLQLEQSFYGLVFLFSNDKIEASLYFLLKKTTHKHKKYLKIKYTILLREPLVYCDSP